MFRRCHCLFQNFLSFLFAFDHVQLLMDSSGDIFQIDLSDSFDISDLAADISVSERASAIYELTENNEIRENGGFFKYLAEIQDDLLEKYFFNSVFFLASVQVTVKKNKKIKKALDTPDIVF